MQPTPKPWNPVQGKQKSTMPFESLARSICFSSLHNFFALGRILSFPFAIYFFTLAKWPAFSAFIAFLTVFAADRYNKTRPLVCAFGFLACAFFLSNNFDSIYAKIGAFKLVGLFSSFSCFFLATTLMRVNLRRPFGGPVTMVFGFIIAAISVASSIAFWQL